MSKLQDSRKLVEVIEEPNKLCWALITKKIKLREMMQSKLFQLITKTFELAVLKQSHSKEMLEIQVLSDPLWCMHH